jgi:hypothetical protein
VSRKDRSSQNSLLSGPANIKAQFEGAAPGVSVIPPTRDLPLSKNLCSNRSSLAALR